MEDVESKAKSRELQQKVEVDSTILEPGVISHEKETESAEYTTIADETTPTQSAPPPPPLSADVPISPTSSAVDGTANLLVVDDNELLLLTTTKSDKAVCTNDTLEDLQRALTYEAVFSSLLEKKVLAMKRDCEERKRAKRMKRKSLGRIFFAKKLFGSSSSRKSSICGKPDSEPPSSSHGSPEPLTRRALARMRASESHVTALPHSFRTAKAKKTRSVDEIEAATTSMPSGDGQPPTEKSRSKTKIDTATDHKADVRRHTQAADESIASTLSNSSEKYSNGGPTIKRSLLVRAQTHTHTGDSMAGADVISSSSEDSKDVITTPRCSHKSNGNGTVLSASLPYDTASLPSAYENALGSGIGGDRVHTSTMAEDSLTSIRDDADSIESLSFASSRYTVSFGGTEIIPEETSSLLYERERERVRVAKRLRILEAKSISAQCSPIFPRHIPKTEVIGASTQRQTPFLPMTTVMPTLPLHSTAQTCDAQTHIQTKIQDQSLTSKKPFLPKQVSYTENLHYGANGSGGDSINIDAAYLRYFSRQNTSEDSANLTVSTLLNQSDSLSLHLPPSYASQTFLGVAAKPFDRYKSKSTSLLVVTSNGRSRPPPPILRMTPTSSQRIATTALPISQQLAQLQITSNINHNLENHLVDSLSKTQTQTQTQIQTRAQTHKRQLTTFLTALSHGVESAPQHNITTVSSTLEYYQPVIASSGNTAATITSAHGTASTTVTGQIASTSLSLSPKTVGESTYRNGITDSNGAIVTSSYVHDETAKLNRMTSTSTGSSVAPTGCCTTMKSSSRDRDKEKEKDKDRQFYHHFKPSVQTGQGGSDDEYRRRKRKYKRYHRCSDPVLVYPTPSGLQHCILSIPPSDPVQFSYGGDFVYDMQIQMDSDKIVVDAVDTDDLEEIVPSSSHRHRRHRHHRHKKRHRHKKPKILVQDLETQVVKVIDPDDLPQRARWTIIATACLLLIMCLMLVGITLRMAPIIDDMDFDTIYGLNEVFTNSFYYLYPCFKMPSKIL